MKLVIGYLLITSSLSYGVSYRNDLQTIFTQIFFGNFWTDPESVSGTGSNLTETAVIRQEIPNLLKTLNAKSLLDAPCGDFFWMKHVNLDFLDSYIGFDIVKELITQNQTLYGNNKRIYMHKNIITDVMPQVDVILCRDALVHLTIEDIFTTLKNFKKSKSKYLLTTTFTKKRPNSDIETGFQWRPLNLNLAPFNFPQPLHIINEECPQAGFADKSLALWRLDDLIITD